MKIHVITDDKNKIIGTVQSFAGSHGDLPIAQPIPISGQKVHEIVLPKELHGLRNADELHKQLVHHLPK
jgi:hypothetical protein